MKKFSKEELFALIIIFGILIVISVPNFVVSLRRSRDQTRRDELGAIQAALGNYHEAFGSFPASTPDGKLLACKRPEDKVTTDAKGNLVVNLIPCEWGRDGLVDLTPGSSNIYIKTLPGDPFFSKGVSYRYISDGNMFQLFGSFEGSDEAEYDSKIVDRNIKCGNKICNVGRYYACTLDKTLEQCEAERAKANAK